jgi:hypothetical protein
VAPRLPIAVTGGRGRATIAVMPYVRLQKLEHFFGEARTYCSEHWGMRVRRGVGLLGRAAPASGRRNFP